MPKSFCAQSASCWGRKMLIEARKTFHIDTGVPSAQPEKTTILGIPVNLINMKSAIATIMSSLHKGEAGYICIRDVHGIMQAQADPELRRVHENAMLVTPDGMPLVWIGRARAGNIVGRVCGTDLVDALCAASLDKSIRHYFFGGKPGVAASMAAILQARYPGLSVAGSFCPSFGDVSPEEDARIVEAISAAKPDVIWVGLSSPKQEYWMRDHVGQFKSAILIGVGAAFDFQTGKIARAPVWMQNAGLEWLHRLYSEPRRLWRRYLVLAPVFALRALWEQIFSKAWSRAASVHTSIYDAPNRNRTSSAEPYEKK